MRQRAILGALACGLAACSLLLTAAPAAAQTNSFALNPRRTYLRTGFDTDGGTNFALDVVLGDGIYDLQAMGHMPGEVMTLKVKGAFGTTQPGNPNPETDGNRWTGAVFSSSAVLDPNPDENGPMANSPSEINRIPGAIGPVTTMVIDPDVMGPPIGMGGGPANPLHGGPNLDNVTLNTNKGSPVNGALMTDFPEDFRVDVPYDDGTGYKFWPTGCVQVTIPVGARYLFIAAMDTAYNDNGDPNNDYGIQISTPGRGGGGGGGVPEGSAGTLLISGLLPVLGVLGLRRRR